METPPRTHSSATFISASHTCVCDDAITFQQVAIVSFVVVVVIYCYCVMARLHTAREFSLCVNSHKCSAPALSVVSLKEACVVSLVKIMMICMSVSGV